jgi:hypothetical protein
MQTTVEEEFSEVVRKLNRARAYGGVRSPRPPDGARRSCRVYRAAGQGYAGEQLAAEAEDTASTLKWLSTKRAGAGLALAERLASSLHRLPLGFFPLLVDGYPGVWPAGCWAARAGSCAPPTCWAPGTPSSTTNEASV